MRNVIIAILLTAGGLLLGSCQEPAKQEATAPDLQQIRSEIQAMENAYAAAENAKNADAIGATGYYAEDAISLPSEEPAVAGKTAIIQRLRDQFAKDTTSGTTIQFEVIDLFADGNLVVEVGKTISRNPAGEVSTGKYMSLFEKRNGKYVCIRDIWNSDRKKGI